MKGCEKTRFGESNHNPDPEGALEGGYGFGHSLSTGQLHRRNLGFGRNGRGEEARSRASARGRCSSLRRCSRARRHVTAYESDRGFGQSPARTKPPLIAGRTGRRLRSTLGSAQATRLEQSGFAGERGLPRSTTEARVTLLRERVPKPGAQLSDADCSVTLPRKTTGRSRRSGIHG
jgi:hypothetical protein